MNRPDEKDKGLVLKEYGRNTQRLVDYLMTIEDREKRSVMARTLIELMLQLNPATKETTDHTQRLWDHLYIMSDFKLDVDTEYVLPEKSILEKKPQKVEYNNNQLKFKHYGKNIELLVAKALEKEEPQEIEDSVIYLGRLMKRFYSTWNKENVEDELILQQLNILSKGKLSLPIDRVKSENLFNITLGEPSKDLNKFNSLFVNYPDREVSTSTSKNFGNNNGSNGGNNGFARKNGKPNNFKKKPSNPSNR